MPATVDSGTMPAQVDDATSSGGSSDHPSFTLADVSSNDNANTFVWRSSTSLVSRTSAGRPGIRCSDSASSAASF